MPGQAQSVAGAGFSIADDWVNEEREDTFTRVTVSDVKPEILEQFQGEEAEHVCRQLAHLYHYYLHGPSGNTGAGECALSAALMQIVSNSDQKQCSDTGLLVRWLR